jgi:hypothetical protein
MTEQWFLTCWMTGTVALVGALFVARLNWQPGVRPFGRGSSTFDILLHPERYARRSSLRLIRTLSWLGGTLLMAGVALLVHEAVWPSRVR